MGDGGAPKQIKRFARAHMSINHIDSLKDLKDLTGARAAVHRLDVECVEKGEWIECAQAHQGVETIYLGHGKPFSVDILEKSL